MRGTKIGIEYRAETGLDLGQFTVDAAGRFEGGVDIAQVAARLVEAERAEGADRVEPELGALGRRRAGGARGEIDQRQGGGMRGGRDQAPECLVRDRTDIGESEGWRGSGELSVDLVKDGSTVERRCALLVVDLTLAWGTQTRDSPFARPSALPS